jgi:penicillin amidase
MSQPGRRGEENRGIGAGTPGPGGRKSFSSLVRVMGAVFLLFLAACAPWAYLSYRIDPGLPAYQGKIVVVGLKEPVEVSFDEFAVPRVQARSEEDLYFAVGYLHARERLFQMEFLRRLALGRLAEVFGNRKAKENLVIADTISLDRWLRTIGFARAARRSMVAMDEESRRAVEAYVAGINAFVQEDQLPLEFRMLRFRPDPWEVWHVVAVARLVGWAVSFNHLQELTRYLLSLELGAEGQREVFPPLEHPGPSIIPVQELGGRAGRGGKAVLPSGKGRGEGSASIFPGDRWQGAAAAVLAGLSHVSSHLETFLAQGGSNSWALGANRTASGRPLLANDPHLSHTAPSLFYALDLKAPGLEVSGVTIPGTPAVLLGRNRYLAWGLTASFADTQDLYLERLDAADPNCYLTEHGSQPFAVEEHRILERRMWLGVREHRFRVRLTRHGPVLNDALPGKLSEGAALITLRTTMAEGTGDLLALLRIARARRVEEFERACRSWEFPAQNWLVADEEGGLLYFLGGKVPRRRGWDGTMPVPGWTGEYEWDGFLSDDELPRLSQPASGLIVTANNKILPAEYSPYPISFDALPGYRAERIQELLARKERWSAKEVQGVQTDVYVKQAERLLPPLLSALERAPLDDLERSAREELARWDRFAGVESRACTIFFATYRLAWEMTLKDDLSPLLYELLTQNIAGHGFFDRLWADHPQARIFDRRQTPEREGRDEILVEAFREAVRKLEQKMGPQVSKWEWGRFHTLTFRHPLGASKVLSRSFNIGPLPLPGARETVWAAGFSWEGDLLFPVFYGPVFRQIHDLGDPEGSGFILDLGQSGWPASPHYQNALPRWRQGDIWRGGRISSSLTLLPSSH